MNQNESRGLTMGMGDRPARGNGKFHARRLATCVAAAISPMFVDAASAAYPPALQDTAFLAQPLAGQPNPSSPNPPWIVQNCNNDGAGSLRDIITSVAQSGDTVDLSQLTCSTITLTTGGEIVVAQNYLTILGPTTRSLMISGNDASRVFHHTGAGLLYIEDVTITHGYAHASSGLSGGCIYSLGSVRLFEADVTYCNVRSETGRGEGGGVFSQHSVSLIQSTISNNTVNAPMTFVATGGGVATSGDLLVKYSSISANTVHDAGSGTGGGAYSGSGNASIIGTTIDQNYAPRYGGLHAGGTSDIVNTTISENVSNRGAALYATQTTISNTTIAFNHAKSVSSRGAVIVGAGTNSVLDSSIIANNTAGISNTSSDLYVANGMLSGADNLVIASNQNPPGLITVTTDPKLGPLQFNGGPTRTHALLRGSPAIGMGNNNKVESYDQRGIGYPRSTGAPPATTDIGSFEFDTIFAHAFD